MPDYESMRAEIKAFKETEQLKLADDELLTVLQYIELKKAFDPNDKLTKYEPYLVLEPFVQIAYKESEQYRLHQAEIKRLNQIDTFFHNDYLIDASLDGFLEMNQERNALLTQAKTYVSAFQKGKFIKGLYIYGKYRTGKTYLLSAIANELIKKDVSIVFAYFPDLVRSIKQSLTDQTLEKKIKQLKSCDLLILDDLGAEHMTAWFRDEIFGPILQYRLSLGLSICISSNHKLADLHRLFTDTKDDIDKVKSMRIITRIIELTKEVKLNEERYDQF